MLLFRKPFKNKRPRHGLDTHREIAHLCSTFGTARIRSLVSIRVIIIVSFLVFGLVVMPRSLRSLEKYGSDPGVHDNVTFPYDHKSTIEMGSQRLYESSFIHISRKHPSKFEMDNEREGDTIDLLERVVRHRRGSIMWYIALLIFKCEV